MNTVRRNLNGALAAAGLVLAQGWALALNPQLLQDINPSTGGVSSSPSNIVDVNGVTFFTSADFFHGTELWKSDGSAAGTVLVKDIWPGGNGSSPSNLTNVGGTLYFSASDPTNGVELWKSDGTEAGTVLVKDIYPGGSSSTPSSLTNVGGTLYFSASEPTAGAELWKSDGTSAGTVLVKDIRAGVSGSTPSGLTNVGGALYFSAFDATNGSELWKSDGTGAGTVLVKDIYPGGSSSTPSSLTNVGGTLYFSASEPTAGAELWKSDGTSAGTVLVKDLWPGAGGSSPSALIGVGGLLYFRANDGPTGQELWKTDGTGVGTVLVKDIYSGSGSSSPQNLTSVGGTLYFSASDPTNGAELWKSDGTGGGTVLVKDVYSGSSGSSPQSLTNVGGTLYFSAADPANGTELWKSNGTSAGTVLVKNIYSGSGSSSPSSLANVGGTLYFGASDSTNGTELWKSDGTLAGTVLVKDIWPGSGGSSPASLTNVGGTLYFSASEPTNGAELWKSDGTAGGTALVKNIYPGGVGSSPASLTNVAGTLYFSAADSTNGAELWKSDGTAVGTVLVKNIYPGGVGSSPSSLTNLGGTLYFSASDATNGAELWKSDGTAVGTVLVKNIYSGGVGSSPSSLTNVAGTLYFSAADSTNGAELWKSDGTAGGTALVKDIYLGSGGSSPSNLTSVGGTLYFSASDPANGAELWKSDGTSAGTALVKDIYSGSIGASPQNLTNVGGTLYFSASDPANGTELWKSDGTSAGTVLVKDIYAGVGGSSPSKLTSMGGALYFSASDPTNGVELWKSDGTSVGTTLVKDIWPGGSNSNPNNLTTVAGTLYFRAADPTNGNELWRSDGTSAGTVLAADIAAGDASSSPSGLLGIGRNLYFSANDGYNGLEPWRYFHNNAPLALADARSTAEDTPLSVSAPGVLGNDSDADGDPLVALLVSGPAHASSFTLNANGSFTYTPSSNYNGPDSFTYKANDGYADSAPVAVSLTIDSVNDAPSFVKGADPVVLEDAGTQSFGGWATSINPGAPDEVGQTVSFHVTGNTNPGLFSAAPAVDSSGTLTFTSMANANGTATITLVAQDNGGTLNGGIDTSAPQSFEVTVTSVNDPPVASFSASPNPAACGQGITFDGGASSDIDGSIASYAWDFGDGNTGSGTSITHAYSLFGNYTATLTVTDNGAPPLQDQATRSLSVNLGNQAPVAVVGGPYSVVLGNAVSFSGSGSHDPDAGCGDGIVSYAWLVNGTISLSGASPTLSPAQVNALGEGTFSVSLTVTDTFGASGTDSGSLTVNIFSPVPTAGLPGVANGSAAWGDYDNDGRLDALLVGDTGAGFVARIYRSEGGDAFTDIGAGLPGVANGSVAWGDSDNDGKLDVLLSGDTGAGFVARIYRNEGGDAFTDIGAGLPGVANGSVAWGDYDNDGKLDVLLSGDTGAGFVARIYRNEGGGAFTDIGASLPGVAYGSVAWGDYDNDDRLDVLLSGDTGSGFVARIYRNEGGGAFTDIGAGLPGVANGSVAWGDYDNDAKLDVLLSGDTGAGFVARIYRNEGGDAFTDIGAGLPGVAYGSAAWGDYDNDGRLDVLLAGWMAGPQRFCGLYRNAGGDTFSSVSSGLAGVAYAAAAWGDEDNDGRLDLLLTGEGGSGLSLPLYRNNTLGSNTAPSAASGLGSSVNGTSAVLAWSGALDGQTPPEGLAYNLRVGTAPGLEDVVAPMSDTASGWRRLPALGNAQSGLAALLEGLPYGTYFWSVQAIDSAYAGSAFAAESSFVITTEPLAAFSAAPNPAACGQAVSFDGRSSWHPDPNRSIVAYDWDFGDGSAHAGGSQPQHAYGRFGSYTATLTVTDDNAPPRTGQVSHSIGVDLGNRAPSADASGPYSAALGGSLTLVGSGSSDPDSGCGDGIVSYEWTIDGALALSGATPTLGVSQILGLGVGSFPVQLVVTDTFGATSTASTTLTITSFGDRPFVSFSSSLGHPNTLMLFVDASASTCNGSSSNCDAYDWDWGDGSAHDGGVTASHTYAAAGVRQVTLTVTQTIAGSSSLTRTVALYTPDFPPVAAGTACGLILDANTWAATLIDASTDDNGVAQVTVSWGDGTLLSDDRTPPFGPFSHTYPNPGTFTIYHKAIDTIGQQNIRTCTVSPAYFSIDGIVYQSDGVTGVPAAQISVMKGTILVKTVYTSATGAFSAGNLKPGTYTLTVAKAGFTFASPAATLTIGPSSGGNVILATGP